ncbi:MAG: arginine--tRNA ligase [Candidatus Magasanikbacteria bacterium]
MLQIIEKQLKDLLKKAGVTGEIEFTKPPKADMGDVTFACFDIAKVEEKNPVEVAKDLTEDFKFQISNFKLFDKVEAFGPYINFFLNSSELAELVLQEVDKKDFGQSEIGKGKKFMVEFAHPNTHKAFHIGHLRNAITGESIVRILENAGHKVVRANYQGDVGMHIAKCLYTILKYDKDGIANQKKMSLDERIKYLGKMYAQGSQEFEESEQVRKEVGDINIKIYEQDKSIKAVYKETRKWSLEYFDKIYKRLDTKFDRFYFESEVFARGKEITLEFLKQGVFKKSQGAIIFEGSKHNLHDRVFINSKGYPTYEAKDLALAEIQFKEHKPDKILHVVAREQLGYFQVMFKALENTLPISKDREKHLVYGWVSLKHGKMSSRTGKVILGEWLLDELETQISEYMSGSTKVTPDKSGSTSSYVKTTADKKVALDKKNIAKKVAIAAVKYSFLRIGIANDMQFDIDESVSTVGDSGPYLLYITARIKSILKKEKGVRSKEKELPIEIQPEEKQLLIKLSEFEEVAKFSAENLDPSKIARYLFDLAQNFNSFYENCPVVKAEGEIRIFRLQIIKSVAQVMKKGLYLLGIETVEEM